MWSNYFALASFRTKEKGAMSYRVSFLSLLAFLALWPSYGQAQLQLAGFDMTRAVDILADRFQSIANDGLGVDALKRSYQSAAYSYSELNETRINELLSDPVFATSINDVLSLFDSIPLSSDSSNLDITDCCSSANSNPDSSCCYGCQSPPSDTIASIASAYESSNLIADTTLLFGSPDGSLLVHPPSTPPSDCAEQGLDARLQTWFASETRDNPVEVVVVLDALQRRVQIPDDESYDLLNSAVLTVARSLTNQDRIALVGVDSSPQIPRATIFSLSTETIPVCAEAVIELEAFITSFTPVSVNYDAAFATALGLFSDSHATDKLLLFFTPGVGLPFDLGTPLSDNQTSRTGVTVSAIRLVDDTTPILSRIVTSDGSLLTLLDFDLMPTGPLSSSVGNFYPLNVSTLTPTSEVTYGHAISAAGGSLSLTRPYFNNSTFVGVLRALLPWERLLNHILSALADRPSSYVFVTDSGGRVLFHPLVPSDSFDNVKISYIESEVVPLLATLGAGDASSVVTAAVTKRLLQHTGSRDESAFIPRTSPSTYHCRQLSFDNADTFNLCLVLADADVSVASLVTVDPSGLYVNGNSAPVYHNLGLSSVAGSTCNYFCKRSRNDVVSFQLTGSGIPADDTTFVNDVTNFIAGDSSSPPSGVAQLVATEIALASTSVASRWTNTSQEPSAYITRRHLVTSSGAYLTYPAVQLSRDFVPSRTEWYQAAAARGDLLTLTPPRADSLNEGGEFAISATYSVRAPSQQGTSSSGSTRPLVVVAADLTVPSVRSFVRAAVPDCEEDPDASCFIIDDMGHLIYDRELLASGRYRGIPQFLGKPLEDMDFLEYRGVLFDLIRGGSNLMEKEQCVDYYSPDIETRRFYRLDTSSTSLIMNVGQSSFCIDYMLQNIPGTNTFLVVLKRKKDCDGNFFCLCSLDDECTDCRQFNNRSCECPCVCSDNCRPDPGRQVHACPQIVTQNANLVAASSASLTSIDLNPQFCFEQQCNCRNSLDSCLSGRDCSWCEQEQKCVHITDCCTRDEEGACCGQSPQQERFFGYGNCGTYLRGVCQNEPGAFNAVCPSLGSNQTSIIIAVVVGCIFGLILVGILVIFIVWYQFFRKSDVSEETSRESAFDFSKKRMDSTNPMATVKDQNADVKSDTGSEIVNNATKGMSPTNDVHPQTSSNEKANGKDESNL